MTKKHFIQLAKLIKARPHCFSGLAIESLADFCADQNPNINRDRWLSDIRGLNGPGGGKIHG